MTNIERQKSLDKKKWEESSKVGKDMSGKMDYCNYCSNRIEDHDYYRCNISQSMKESNNICATSYNRMIRKQKELLNAKSK